MTKKEQRREFLNRRDAIPPEKRRQDSEAVCDRFFRLFGRQESPCLFSYMTIRSEVDTAPIHRRWLAGGGILAVPRVEGKQMRFYRIRGEEDLVPGSYGVREPAEGLPPADDLDGIMLVPGAAFTVCGDRMGYGGGFYDRYLAEHQGHRTIALAFDEQITGSLLTGEHDRRVDMVLTPSRTYDGKAGTLPREDMDGQRTFMELCREKTEEAARRKGRPLTACPRAFGCQMNAHDGEKLAGILEEIGYRIVDDDEADLVLYDTCAVRENAEQRILGRLGFLYSMKKKNPDKIICLCGCMTQVASTAEKIRRDHSYVDIVFGTHNVHRLAEFLYRRFCGENPVVALEEEPRVIAEDLPLRREYTYKSGVNITYGCNNFCSYCIVPYVRGRERSRDRKDILEEIRRLAADGVVEVMLLGQNVNSYGRGNPEACDFPTLLEDAAKIDGIERIRFMTSHPKDLSDRLIDVIASSEKICRHLHLPLQSGSTKVLREMNRGYTKEGYLALVDRIRERIPGISLTTDIIVGFPGETEEDFADTLDVVEKVRYQSAFTFQYSPRTGTPAAARSDQVPHGVVQERFDRLLSAVQRISAELTEEKEGTEGIALVESVSDKDPSLVTGRLSDNLMVHFPGDASLIGKLVPVFLEKACGFYYRGRRIG